MDLEVQTVGAAQKVAAAQAMEETKVVVAMAAKMVVMMATVGVAMEDAA